MSTKHPESPLVPQKSSPDALTALIENYVNKLDWQVSENSNMTYSLQGLQNYVSSEVTKAYWLNKMYPEDIRNAHQSGDFHLHDLNSLSVYCVGWNLQDLLLEGFCGVRGKVESSPPKHFRSALGQIVNFLYTLQGESAGAQAFSNFDSLLAPFIRYDNLTDKQIRQALQEFLFQMNVPTRVGFQTPFTNVSLDLTVPGHLKDQPVIIGGKLQKDVYGQFQPEIDRFNKAFIDVMLHGDARERAFAFPIPTYGITKDFDWENPAIKGLWELTAKYGVPYFSNFVNSEMSPEDARSMCCRLRIDNRELRRRGGGLFGASPLTGSIGVVTINLPRIGFLAATEEEFFTRLETLMSLAKKSLEIKREVLEDLTNKNLYPYIRHYLRFIKEKTSHYWANHFSTIGIVGMNEAILNLFGASITSPKGQAFACKTLDFMRQLLLKYQEETHHNFNLEATPAEGTSYRLAQKDTSLYPSILVANNDQYTKNGASPFYSNSTQIPVDFTDDLFEALDLQDELQTKYTGGTVLHFYVGERIQDPSTVKNMVKRVCEQYKLPYFTFSPTFSICQTHGYIPGEVVTCPKCATKCEVYSRVVGYLRPIDQWNGGKRAEYAARKTFIIEEGKNI
jgi:ribonucleoside-triphosphate reductase